MTARPARVLLVPGLFTLVGVVTLVTLGLWQLDRLAWKNGLIERAQTRSEAAAEPLPPADEWATLDASDYEYRAVTLTGTFRHDDEVHVYTALSNARGASSGPGWWVMTPLALGDGSVVVVNRGFVPEAAKDPAVRAEGQIAGEVTVEGLMRAPEVQGTFVPDDDAAANVWFTRDPARIAAAHDLEDPVAPFFIDARETPPGGLPQGGETRLTFRNDHLGYALTWLGLAATLLGVFAVWAYGRLAGDRRDD